MKVTGVSVTAEEKERTARQRLNRDKESSSLCGVTGNSLFSPVSNLVSIPSLTHRAGSEGIQIPFSLILSLVLIVFGEEAASSPQGSVHAQF